MKILFFIHSLSSGGAERVTVNLANYWAEKDWDMVVVTLASESEDFYKHNSVRRIALNLAGKSPNLLSAAAANLKRLIVIRKTLNAESPDVAVGIMTTANVLLGLSSLSDRIVRVGSERIYPPKAPPGRLWHILCRLSYPRLDAVVALTKESAQWIASRTGARYVEVIPNPVTWPIPLQFPYLKPEDFVPEARKLLLGVGRLTEQKGFDLLIEAFSRLAPRFPKWVLVILGEGPMRCQLEDQVRVRKLQTRVMLPGVAGNIGEWYRRADVYVMSSRFEGFPNALLEAMACGTAVVSFDCPTGPGDIIRHGVDGLLVPNGNIDALTEALSFLMENDDARHCFAQKAIEVRTRFSIETIALLWEKLFEKLCTTKDAGTADKRADLNAF